MTVKKPINKAQTTQPKKPPAKKEPALAVQISQFDKLVSAKDHDAAHEALIKILNILENSSESFGASLLEVNPLVEKQATIFCAAVTRLLADKEFTINDGKFFGLTALKRPLTQSFEISGYRGTDHLIQLMGTPDGKGGTTLTRQEILKLFIGLSINALSPSLVDMLFRQIPNIAWPLCIGFLSEQIVYSENARTARARILAASDKMKEVAPNFSMVRNLGPAYMGCSYDEAVHKHDIKHAMNNLVRRWLGEQGVEDAKLPDERRAVKRRPTLLIIAELYSSQHAMHHCYGPSIASLKSHFRVILMTPTGEIDENLTSMFDKIDPMKFDIASPKAFIEKAKSYRPDIVYFPSIGMRPMSIICSNIRIAPIQMFTPGHPATTNSEHVDYIVLMEGCLGHERSYSEKVLLRNKQPYFEMRADAVTIEPNISIEPAIVRIAVPAWSRKVAPGFLQICWHIESEAKKSGKHVEFYFFPNAVGALLQGFTRRVKSILNATVFPRTNYNTYIANLNKCDLFLSTFPFGATNSIVDATLQGLPVVNMMGQEAHSVNDSDMLKSIDQPDWLSATDKQTYIAAAMRLILQDAERVKISRSILACDPSQHFLVEVGGKVADFADMFFTVYKQHDRLSQSTQKVWRHNDLAEIEK